jgi:hypothetical protein
MSDIPETTEMLELIDTMNQETEAPSA